MINIVWHDLIIELATIERRTKAILQTDAPLNLYADNNLLTGDQNWLAILCLISAQVAKEINPKAVKLAGCFHLLNFAVSLHWYIPEESNDLSRKEKIQYPILVGDLLYSHLYLELYQNGLEGYLEPFSQLLSSINEEFYKDQSKVIPGRGGSENTLKIYTMMGVKACCLGSNLMAGSTYISNTLKSIGYHIGFLKHAKDYGYKGNLCLDNWYQVWSSFDMIPPGAGKEMIASYLQDMGLKWGLVRPGLEDKEAL